MVVNEGPLLRPTAPSLTTIGGSITRNGLTVQSSLAFPELRSVRNLNWTTLPVIRGGWGVVWGGGLRIDQLFFSIGDACCTVVLFPGDLDLLVLGLCDAATM
jgi:hypothetical protein